MAMDQSDRKRITIDVDGDLHSRLQALAERDKRSLRQELAWLLERAVEEGEAIADQRQLASQRGRTRGSQDGQ